jgi:hypothetical protein
VRHVWALAGILSALLALLSAVSPAVAAADCQFTLGFKALHDMIPTSVGNCVEDVHYNPANGDGLQMTTNGLLVWRKADNFTAFTDGFHTWVNGPFGLQRRLNIERFPWEVLTLDDLKNATYMVEGPPGGVAKLTNGMFAVPAAPGSASLITVTLLDQPIAYADLTGDGEQEAAVILEVSTGGSGNFNYLAVVKKVNGIPQNIATVFLGDRVKVENATIGPGTITVDMLRAGPGQPLCCPNELVSQTYKLQGNQLIRIS